MFGMDIDYMKSILSLENKRAVVTGGSSGIGRGIALSLAKFGAEVSVLGRNGEELKRTKALVEETGGRCSYYRVEQSDPEEIRRFFQEYHEKNGAPDIYVANAGINIRGELLDTKQEELDRLIDVNYRGCVIGLMEAGKQMKEQKSGSIVVISSVNGISAMPNLAVYSSLKYALEGITRALAASLAPWGIRVNSCAPGVILSRINEKIYADEEKRRAKIENIPLGRLGEPSDIGDAVACMAGGAFGFMTGTTVVIDGGELIRKMQRQ